MRKAALSQSCRFALFVNPVARASRRSATRRRRACNAGTSSLPHPTGALRCLLMVGERFPGQLCCEVDNLSTNVPRTFNESIPYHTLALLHCTCVIFYVDAAFADHWWCESTVLNLLSYMDTTIAATSRTVVLIEDGAAAQRVAAAAFPTFTSRSFRLTVICPAVVRGGQQIFVHRYLDFHVDRAKDRKAAPRLVCRIARQSGYFASCPGTVCLL